LKEIFMSNQRFDFYRCHSVDDALDASGPSIS
jgi:hypothetical protein